MVAIFIAFIAMIICTVSVNRSQVPSQRDYKEVPLQTDYKEVPLQTDYKETPSQRDYKELEVPSQRDYKEVPSQRDYKEVPLQTDYKEVPLQTDYKETPSQRDYKELEVPSQTDYKEIPSQRYYKEAPSLPSIPKYDTMPLVKYIRSREELQSTEWVSLLFNFLKTLNKSVSPHVNMVFGDNNHIHLLENWITAAVRRLKPPLHNVMVLSLDYTPCNLLLFMNISLTCIPVIEESLIVVYPNGSDASWSSAMMIRQIVLRLINYWGYDVASYDTDAVLLHNPQVLYDSQPYVDVFSASTQNFPKSVCDKWGFNLCGAALMLRASPAVGVCCIYIYVQDIYNHYHEIFLCTEALWSNISALVIEEVWDDQIALNVAIDNMGVMWDKTTKVKEICSVKNGWKSKSVINIFVFPQYQICRHCCKPSLSHNTLYIAHPPGDHFKLKRKEDALKKMKAWFL